MTLDAEALHQRGLDLLKRGVRDEARRAFEQALALEPARPKTLNNLARLDLEDGRAATALGWIERSLSCEPGAARTRGLHGQALALLDRAVEAIPILEAALAAEPSQPAAWAALARAKESVGERAAALGVLERAVARLPDNAALANNLGALLTRLGRDADALAEYARATELDGTLVDALANYGDALRRANRMTEAEAVLRRALERAPAHAEASLSLATILATTLRADEALSLADRALPGARGKTRCKLGAHRLFTLTHRDEPTAARLLDEHRRWAAEWLPPTDEPPPRPSDRPGPLRIAYLSSDFRNHVVHKFMAPVLASHDRARVDVTLLSMTTERDDTTRRLEAEPSFVDVTAMTSAELARELRARDIDVVIDLNGTTDEAVLMQLERRLAPVQLTYLGYPSTTGVDRFDGRITDAWVDPPGSEAEYSEPLVRLGRTIWAFAPRAVPSIVDRPPDAPVIFGGFNRPEKMSPRLLAAWREILLRTDRSRLVVRGKAFAGSGVRDRFFAMLGHDLEPRVDVAPYAPGEMGAYAGYAAMDVALDTFPYHGTTTTCDALAMGVPVVSWQGATPPARVGRSLLAAVGLADLSVDDRDAYVAKALELAADTERRRELRRTLRDRLRASPLGDPVGLARALEELYRALVEQRRRGEPLRFG